MAYNRRFFLKAAGFSAAAALTGGYLSSCSTGGKETTDAEDVSGEGITIPDFGLQLYSARDVIGADPKGVLKQLADMGYKKIESYQGEQGIFWGMSPKEFKAYMDELGMTIVSSHADTTKDLQQLAGQAAEAGLTYLLQPYIGAQPTLDDWKIRADEFNQRGEICKKEGIKFGYHNHDYSFKELDGIIPQELLLEQTDPGLVVYELDLCWIYVAGIDPAEHLVKYSGRYELCHIKDVVKMPEVKQRDLGTGEIDFKRILKVAMENGMTEFIVEQEQYPESVMSSLANDADYMKQLIL